MDSLLDRFLRYVKIDTQSDEKSTASPSTAKQLELSHLLEGECSQLGLKNVTCFENGVVMATIPATNNSEETIFWNSHIDTSPEYTGTNVNPIVHKKYSGGDIVLPGDPTKKILVKDNPSLERLKGTTIITTDGKTLLGADDKAGIAVIMTAAQFLQDHPEIMHGPIRVCFTVDEEIGRGTSGLNLEKLDSVCGYTLDSQDIGMIDIETFSADLAIVTVSGVNSHPSEAKAKGMVNAVKILANYLSRLPANSLAPEITEGREGFIHPYSIEGGVAQASARIILRDFETSKLEEYAHLLRSLAKEVSKEFSPAVVDVAIKKQYRNMRQGLEKEPRAVAYALEAMRNLGIEPKCNFIRGGTDGALLTELGVPCPNLFCGQHNLHSPLEWASLWEMEKAVEVLVQLAIVWGRNTKKV